MKESYLLARIILLSQKRNSDREFIQRKVSFDKLFRNLKTVKESYILAFEKKKEFILRVYIRKA